MAKQNTRDTDGKSLAIGVNAENLFVQTARNLGWSVYPATKKDDREKHLDFYIKKGKEYFTVEVKARKRISRQDIPQDEWTWIELHGEQSYNQGWLYGGADLIAFELENSFILVNRGDLILLVTRLGDFGTVVSSPYDAKYKLYSRNGLHDLTMLIETSKIKEIKWNEWRK